MCGICGMYGFEDEVLLRRMCSILSHRGPEDEGYFIENNISLGHTRLSIIDIKGGHQPIHNEDESIWVVLNGEIFNYRDLREKLESRHKFYSNSDTEVLVHLYEDYKEEFVRYLRGQFAFALWDSDRRKLILVRDRLGICPLYYTMLDNKLLFASEIKSILEYKEMPVEIDDDGLIDYLLFQAPVGPHTLFRGIKELLPGYMIICEAGEGTSKRYWDISNFVPDNFSEEYYTQELMEKLKDAVQSHLVSDVPVGMYLSGGIDSSIILSLMNIYYKSAVDTFTLGFDYKDVDETDYARAMAEYAGANYHEVILYPEMVMKESDKIFWYLDDPIADFGEIKDYFLSTETQRQGIKVVLYGYGGDELFGGYGGYKDRIFCDKVRKFIPKTICSTLPKVANFVPLSLPKSDGVKKYLRAISGEEPYMSNGDLLSYDKLRTLYRGDNRFNSHGRDVVMNYFFNPEIHGLLNKCQYVDIKIYIDAHMLHFDKMNMAHAVECRHPFLDYHVVETAFTIPENLRIKNGVEKYILRKAGLKYDILPDSILKRKKKGFIAPHERWMSSNKDFRDFVFSGISDSEIINEKLDTEKVRKMMVPKPGHWDAHKLWGLFVLAKWYERYLERFL